MSVKSRQAMQGQAIQGALTDASHGRAVRDGRAVREGSRPC